MHHSRLKKILIYLFNAATLFTNVKIVIGNRPLTSLNITPILKALQLLKNIKEYYTDVELCRTLVRSMLLYIRLSPILLFKGGDGNMVSVLASWQR